MKERKIKERKNDLDKKNERMKKERKKERKNYLNKKE